MQVKLSLLEESVTVSIYIMQNENEVKEVEQTKLKKKVEINIIK